MTILMAQGAKSADETLALLRTCQGEAETARQLALLRQAAPEGPGLRALRASVPG
jgi:hypothetical protein